MLPAAIYVANNFVESMTRQMHELVSSLTGKLVKGWMSSVSWMV